MANKTGIRIVNLSEVIGDFTKYDMQTKGKFKEALLKSSREVKSNQYSSLKSQVKKWTGNLGNSIAYKIKGLTATIGPNPRVAPYADFIEVGGQPYGNPNARRFPGYWYVRNSLRGIEKKLANDIKKTLTSTQKR